MKLLRIKALSLSVEQQELLLLHGAALEIGELLHREGVSDYESAIGMDEAETRALEIYLRMLIDAWPKNISHIRLALSCRTIRGLVAAIRRLVRPASCLLDELQTLTGFTPEEYCIYWKKLESACGSKNHSMVNQIYVTKGEEIYIFYAGFGEMLSFLWVFDAIRQITPCWKRRRFLEEIGVDRRDFDRLALLFQATLWGIAGVNVIWKLFLLPREWKIVCRIVSGLQNNRRSVMAASEWQMNALDILAVEMQRVNMEQRVVFSEGNENTCR